MEHRGAHPAQAGCAVAHPRCGAGHVALFSDDGRHLGFLSVLTRTGHRLPLPSLPSHPLLEEGSVTLEVARGCWSAPGAVTRFLSPWAGSLVQVSVIDGRDASIDHLRSLVLLAPADDVLGLGADDLRLLGDPVEGDDVGADAVVRASSLARDLGFPSVDALVRHAAREGCYVPPALWP